ncbi:cadherin repeat domain-containing protein, partial [Gammaproteobacteria bacterium]|nr:cadherin repeat domain-containing protein [Gammaproteobacteria bacterium]
MKLPQIIFAILFLFGCGGGGGGGGSAPSAPAPTQQNITVSITTSADSAEINSSITLTWSSTLATSCSASGSWSGSKGTSGSESLIIGVGGTNTFTLSCAASGANSGSASATVDGLRYFDGKVFDGYIRGAEVFVDANDNLSLDAGEAKVITNNQGNFTKLLYTNGTLVSKGGIDLDTGSDLTNLTLVHKMVGYETSKIASPFTTLLSYMSDTSNINAALGIDATIDLMATDPIPNLGQGNYDYMYEKGNQLTVLAYTLQNRFDTTSSQIYFQAIADQLEESFAASQQVVNIEAPIFISNVINKVETARNSTISSDVKANLNTLLVSVIPLLKVSTDANITTAVQRFAFSTLQNDVKDSTVMIGNTSPTLLRYENNVYDYVASDQGIDESAITPAINNAPSFSSSTSFTSAENQTSIGSISATDADGDSLTYSISGSEINISSLGVLTFASAPDYETKNSYTATVTVSDGTASITQSITVTISDVDETLPNEAPSISSVATFSAAENQTSIGSVSATDADGDSLTYSISDSEINISSSGVLSFASAPDYETKNS